jgi:hypothetical protein
VNRITHPKPSQASDYYDRANVQWPLMCRAVLCIDEQAWEGTHLGPLAQRSEAAVEAMVTPGDPGGDLYGTDQKKPPATGQGLQGAQVVTRTGFEPMFST